MKAKTNAEVRVKTKGKDAAGLRSRGVKVPRVQSQPGPRTRRPVTLCAMPAAPVAALGMGELLIRAWAARQHAA